MLFRRDFTQRKANGYGVTGWVKNTPDGKVSVCDIVPKFLNDPKVPDDESLLMNHIGRRRSPRRGRIRPETSPGRGQGAPSGACGEAGEEGD